MADLTIEFEWAIDVPLHLGTGMSQAGYVDRLVREHKGNPYLPGDAIKGAIRGAAERLFHWLVPEEPPEKINELRSVPQNPVLCRIFAPQLANKGTLSLPKGYSPPVYRFPPVYLTCAHKRTQSAATRINPKTGTAQDQTLRFTETWVRDLRFPVEITATGGQWGEYPDDLDLQFLLNAILCTDSIGGKRGIGYGHITMGQVRVNSAEFKPATPELVKTIKNLQNHLRGQASEHKDEKIPDSNPITGTADLGQAPSGK